MWETFCCYAYADKNINMTGSSRMRALQVRFNKSELMRCLETATTCSLDSFISAHAPLKCITHTLFTVLLHPANSKFHSLHTNDILYYHTLPEGFHSFVVHC